MLPTCGPRQRPQRWTKRALLVLLLLGICFVLLYKKKNIDLGVMTAYRDNKATMEIEENLTQILEREVRVLCWVTTSPANHKKKAVHVLRTWGKRCNRLLFVTSQPDDELETLTLPVKDGYDFLWGKTREAFRYIYEHYRNEADWFMKADDDTYVIVENLRSMLYAYSPETPIYFGAKLKKPNTDEVKPYMSGGSGYVLSKEALRLFVEVALADHKKCLTKFDNGAEDVEMGICLQSAGVIPGDSRDAYLKLRFSLFDPHAMMRAGLYSEDFWLHKISFYHTRYCRDCLSNYAVAFHYVQPDDMYWYDFFLYEFNKQHLEEAVETDEILPMKFSPQEIMPPPSDNFLKNKLR